jgi:hypothetical protein
VEVQRATCHSMTRFRELVYIIRTGGLVFTVRYEQVFEQRLGWNRAVTAVSTRQPSGVARGRTAAGCSRLGVDGDGLAA